MLIIGILAILFSHLCFSMEQSRDIIRHPHHNKFIKHDSIQIERAWQQPKHVYDNINEIRYEMRRVDKKINKLSKLRSQLSIQEHQPKAIKTIKSQKIKHDNKIRKPDFKDIHKKVKQTSKLAIKEQITILQNLLNQENQHMSAEDRNDLIRCIWFISDCIPLYSAILDQKICAAQEKIIQMQKLKIIRQAYEKNKTLAKN